MAIESTAQSTTLSTVSTPPLGDGRRQVCLLCEHLHCLPATIRRVLACMSSTWISPLQIAVPPAVGLPPRFAHAAAVLDNVFIILGGLNPFGVSTSAQVPTGQVCTANGEWKPMEVEVMPIFASLQSVSAYCYRVQASVRAPTSPSKLLGGISLFLEATNQIR